MTHRALIRSSFFAAIVSLCALAADKPATTSAVQLKLTQGRQTLALPYPAGLNETSDSTSDLRVLTGGGDKIKVTISLLQAEVSIDPASASSAVEASKGALQAAWGPNLLEPPSSSPDPRFALVMHYRYRTSASEIVDQTRYWRSVGQSNVQCDVQVSSDDQAMIQSANTTVQNWLTSNSEEVTTAQSGPKRLMLGDSGIQFSRPDNFEEIGAQRQNTLHDLASADHTTELIVTLLATAKPTTPEEALAKAKIELAAKKLLSGPELINEPKTTAALHWSFSVKDSTRQAVRLLQRVGSHTVSCDVITSNDTNAALEVARAVVSSLAGGADPAPVPETPRPRVATGHKDQPAPTGDYATRANARAQAALEQAKKLQADGKDDDAYAKYKFIVNEYARTPSAADAEQAIATYESNADFMAKHQPKTVSDEEKAGAMLAMADNYSSAGGADAAKRKYQEVIDKYPNTKVAEKAKKRLAGMK